MSHQHVTGFDVSDVDGTSIPVCVERSDETKLVRATLLGFVHGHEGSTQSVALQSLADTLSRIAADLRRKARP